MEKLEEFIERKIKNKKEDFISMLYGFMNDKSLKASDIYNNALMSRQMFSKIISGQLIPSLKSAVKIALAMHLSNDECKKLLKKLGYTLASPSKFALTIRYCLDHQIYNIVDVNLLLDRVNAEDRLID